MSGTAMLGEGVGSVAGQADAKADYACVICQQRKVKCDRSIPSCSTCAKASAECVYRAPAPPRRKKRKLSSHTVSTGSGVSGDPNGHNGGVHKRRPGSIATDSVSTVASPMTLPRSPSAADGARAVSGLERNKVVYNFFENDLWRAITEVQPAATSKDYDPSDGEEVEYSDDNDQQEQSTDGVDILLAPSPAVNLSSHHPSAEIAMSLWQKYQECVNPLTKMIHIPTTDLECFKDSGRFPEKLSKASECVVFAIYAATINALSEEECETLYGLDRSSLLKRYRNAVLQALANAKLFGTMNFTILQAFVIFLLSMRNDYDTATLWTLIGLAIRIGLRMQLHRENADPRISPFEAEMRRRLWWQVAIVDNQLTEIGGFGRAQWILGETRKPLNLDDSDLTPEMTELPPDREGATEMMFCRLRYYFGHFMTQPLPFFDVDETGVGTDAGNSNLAEKDRRIDELEEIFEKHFLRYCDPLSPLPLLVAMAARCIICRLRFMAHHPRQYSDRGAHLSQEEKDYIFQMAVQTVTYENTAQATKILQRFLWHLRNQVQWYPLVYVMDELRRRLEGPEVDKTWTLVGEIFDNHPELIDNSRKALFRALGSLAVVAWERREAEMQRLHGVALPRPAFISRLLLRKSASRSRKPATQQLRNGDAVNSQHFEDATKRSDQAEESAQPSTGSEAASPAFDEVWNGLTFDLDPNTFNSLNWVEWDELLRDFERKPA